MIKILVTIDCARGVIDENPDKEYYADKLVAAGTTKYVNTIENAHVLYITQVNGFFETAHTFPHFEDKYAMRSQSVIKSKDGVKYQHQVWTLKNALDAKHEIMYNE